MFYCENHGAAHSQERLTHVLYRRGAVEPLLCHDQCNIMHSCRKDCENFVSSTLNLVTVYGVKKLVTTFCRCLAPGTRMMAFTVHGLWPISPDRPETCFSMDLMIDCVTVMYSSKLSLYSFFKYLYQYPKMAGVKQVTSLLFIE